MFTILWRLFGNPKGLRRRPADTDGPPRRKSQGAPRAKPGEIWWADVPFEDKPGSKVRPCLILRYRWRGYDILKITSQDQTRRRDHIEIATTRSWDRDATKNSFLDLTDPLRVSERAVDNRAGVLDAATWAKVRKLHRV